MGILNTFVEWLLDFVRGVIELLPEADFTGLLEFFQPAARLLAWVRLLDEAFPVTEILVGLGLLLGVYGALYAVMIVRRVFSLIWPGAGS